MSRLLAGLPVLAVLLAPAVVLADDDLRTRAAADLKRYYEDRLHRPFIITDDSPLPKADPPPWAAPIQQLSSDKPEERERAVAYLRELLALTLEQERSRTAPSRATPYWGGGAEVPARDLRKEVAAELAKAGPLPDALPVYRWYLDNEASDAFLEPVMVALAKLDGKGPDALRAELALRPHPNALVAAEAIKQIAAKGSLPVEGLAALCQHHRIAVRDAARKLNAQQGGKDPGPFDAAKAVRSEPMRKVMDQVLDLLTDLPPAKADFVKATVRYLDEKKAVRETGEVVGWLTRKDGDVIELYTPYGTPRTIRNGERTHIEHSERLPDGNGVSISKIDVVIDAEVAPAKVEDLIKEVEAARAKDAAGSDLSERGPLTGQFRGNGATLYEAILAAWLYRGGRDVEAARVLLPALDSLYRDRGLVEMVRGEMGDIHGYRMLVAFAGDRDYARALREAKLIDEKYPDTRFHRYAKGLAEQLPRRMDDFAKFHLPTRAEWDGLQKKLSREEQIDFLCERLRLLNCFQMGQPGGYFPDDTQYAEPCGMDANASWGLGKGKTEVINPLTELVGPMNWFDKDKPRPRGLELTLKDVPQLSRRLRDDWYMPIVSFWRDFHPDRSLASTRPEFAQIINSLAGKDVCKIEGWDGLKPEEIDKEIERIDRWAKENAGKTKVELEWEALHETVDAGGEWRDVQGRVEWLLKQKEWGAYDVMKRFLESDKTDAWGKTEILRTYLENDAARAKDLAPSS